MFIQLSTAYLPSIAMTYFFPSSTTFPFIARQASTCPPQGLSPLRATLSHLGLSAQAGSVVLEADPHSSTRPVSCSGPKPADLQASPAPLGPCFFFASLTPPPPPKGSTSGPGNFRLSGCERRRSCSLTGVGGVGVHVDECESKLTNDM